MSTSADPLPRLPDAIASQIVPASARQESIGRSGSQVFAVESAHGPAFLKMAKHAPFGDLRAERDRLSWLEGRLRAPRLLAFAEDDELQYLLMSAMPGVMLCAPELHVETSRLIQRYAEGLRLIHGLPLDDCPFDLSVESRLELARQRVEVGLVDAAHLEGSAPAEYLAALIALRPATAQAVLCHGDYSAPNVLVDPDTLELSGFIDLGRLGAGDPHSDLADAAWSIGYNFGAEWVQPFFEAYGIAKADADRLEFFRLLKALE